MPNNLQAILITGATASGKSSLALHLAKKLNATIINADSIQVYREMHILTARPSIEEMREIPHLLYGHVSVKESYDVGRWLDEAMGAIENVKEKGRLPILVGGTGLYFHALTKGIAHIPDISMGVRQKMRLRYEQEGTVQLYDRLGKIDLETQRRISSNDRQRILRALEVYEETGRCLSEWHKDPIMPRLQGHVIKILLMPHREWLYKKCDQRFEEIISKNVMDEVKGILDLSLPLSRSAMKAIGLSELIAVYRRMKTMDEAVIIAQQKTRRYAKRQTTWFRNQMTLWKRFSEQEYDHKMDNIVSYIVENS